VLLDPITERVVRLSLGGFVASLPLGTAVLVLGRARSRMLTRELGGFVLPVGTYLGMQLTDTPWPAISFRRLAVIGAVFVVVAATGLVLWRHDLDQRGASALILVSLVGVWAGPPENDHTLVAGGAAAGALVVALIRPQAMSWIGAATGAGVVVWASLGGGVGLVDPTVAGYLCLGMLPLGLIAPLLARSPDASTVGWRPLLVGQVAIAGVASRVYAVRSSDAVGLAVTLVTMVCVALALVGVSRSRARRANSPQ